MISFFRHTFQQCRLAIHMETASALPASVVKCSALFGELLTALVSSGDFTGSSRCKEVAVELIVCFLKLGQPALFNLLVVKLADVPQVVQAVLSSPEMWNLIATISGPDKALLVSVLSSFVRVRIASLAVLVEQNLNPSGSASGSLSSSKILSTFNTEWQEHMAKVEKYKERICRSLSSLFRHVIRLAVMSGLKDSGGSSCSPRSSRK